MRTGNYALAARVNDWAAEADRDYMARTGVNMSAYVGYYIHNLHFIAYGRQMEGRFADSLKAARAIGEGVGPMVEQMPAMVDAFVPMAVFTLVRFERWDEVLAEPGPAEKSLASTAIYHWARAIAYEAKGDTAGATRERALFVQARSKIPADWAWLNNKAADVVAVAAAVLDARLAANDAAAIPHWQRAVQLQDALIYDEPPPWFYPIRESLGGALLRAKRPADAEAVFREGLNPTPRNGRMLFGLAESLKAQKKNAAAESVEREFNSAWKAADVKLSIAGL
jgi:hypothetical protein